MPLGKLDLPETLLSLEIMGGSEGEKVHSGSNEDLKDQAASESSIPLSPQWLYSKPSEAKMDMRAPNSTSTGNSNDPNQKDGWRLEGSEEKRDWRRIAAENESSRRWREEERETGMLSARRDRRKTERRVDNASAREDTRTTLSSDRWHDGNNRSSVHEVRRDSKWSSRWGPEDKEKESRTEKRIDGEKEKEDTLTDSQSSISGSRASSEREVDSRDKWRPRHRMEAHSSGSTPHRAAPGFGLERGRVEGSYLGFTLGRGRTNAIGRSSSASSSGVAQSSKGGGVIGKPNLASRTFRYPRGKLLDIYRRQKFDPSFVKVPVEMEEASSVTQVESVEPLAFVTPEAEEEATILDIWKGKITGSGVVYNSSGKGKSTEDETGIGDGKSTEGKQGVLPSVLADETVDSFGEAANDDECRIDDPWNHISHGNIFLGKVPGHNAGTIGSGAVNYAMKVVDNDGGHKEGEKMTECYAGSQLNAGGICQILNQSDGAVSAASDIKLKLPDDSGSLFTHPSSGQSQHNSIFVGSDIEIKNEESETPKDSYFYYIDPNGNTQGPFLEADIILWFEEGYFGMDLPVRSADATEQTPFRSLGDVIPHLGLRGGYSNSELEESIAFEGKVEPSLSPASAPEIAASSSVNNLSQSFSSLSVHSVLHDHARLSEPEVVSQLANTESQNFSDSVAEDEEIVFPGRPGSSEYTYIRSSSDVRDASTKSYSLPYMSNKLSESGFSPQDNKKLHPFGLLWSELEGSHSRHADSSDIPSRIATHLSSQVDPSPNRFDTAEQLMSQQFQQQLQPRNILPAHAHFNDPLLDHLPGQKLIHRQQLASNPAPDLERLLALQLQQRRQVKLQQQQQQLHRQQQFHQQKLLEERQQAQAQARQVLLEQLLHAQMPDSILAQSRIDHIRANNILDQVLLEQQLLQEMQQRSHHPTQQFVPSIEQLNQAKFGQSLQQEQQRDLFQLLSRAQQGQMQPLDHQILLQEQLHARQLSMGLRPSVIREEERHMSSVWPGNENDQFLRNLAGNQRAHASGFGQGDFYQRQQRSSLEDQLNLLDRNHSFQDRLHQGHYEAGSVPFEQSLSFPAGASGINMDAADARVCAQGFDMQDLITRMQSGPQVGASSSSSMHRNPHNSLTSSQFHGSHLDTIEGCWPNDNGQRGNDLVESQVQQMHINSERHKWESEAKINAEADMTMWMSDGMNDDRARQLLMDLLHQKPGQPSINLTDVKDGVSIDKRGSTVPSSIPNSSGHPFSVVPEREAGPNRKFTVDSCNSSVGELVNLGLTEEQAINMEINEKLHFRSELGLPFRGPSIVSGISGMTQAAITDSNIVDKSDVNHEYLEMERRRPRSKGLDLSKGSVTETPDVTAGQVMPSADHVEMSVQSLARNSSLGFAGFFDDEIGPHNPPDEMSQAPGLSRGQENILLGHPPVSQASASQEGQPELILDAASRGKSFLTNADGGVKANNGADSTLSGNPKFRHVSSCGDTDVSEPTFIDMLKSGIKKNSVTDFHPQSGGSNPTDGTQGGRSGKKKGKKGRHINPALLGFTVSSNRIMMGEIQHIGD